MSEKITLDDVALSDDQRRAVIVEARNRKVYNGEVPEEESRLVQASDDIVRISLDEWYASSPAELKGEIGDDVRALLGLAGVQEVDGELVVQERAPIAGDDDPEDRAAEAAEAAEGATAVAEDMDEPWDDYDKSDIGDIKTFIESLKADAEWSDEGRDYVLAYERANKARKGLLEWLKPSAKAESTNADLDAQADDAVARDDRRDEKAEEPASDYEERVARSKAIVAQRQQELNESREAAKEELHESHHRPLAGVKESRHQARERFLAAVKAERLPEPPQPSFDDDPEMPRDVSQLSDAELEQLFVDFNACLARANWLLGLAQVDESYCERAEKKARAHAYIQNRDEKPAEARDALVELDPQVQEWSEVRSEAEQEVKGYGKLASAYQGDVDRLSRIGGFRKAERERS